MATPLQSVAQSAAIPSAQSSQRALLALLSSLQSFVQSTVTTAEVATSIVRTRVSAARQSSTDTYRLIIALPSNVPRVEIVARGPADPPDFVDAVSANGVLFSFKRNGSQWLLQNNAGQTAKLTAISFTRALADALVAFLRSAA